jgi:hypothetical protein
VVSRPVGTWVREVVTQNGNDETPVRVTVKFDEDRLTIRLVGAIDRQAVEQVLEADYSITKDSVVFGVITSYDMRVPAGGRLPPNVVVSEEDYVDQPFTFRFRVDGGTLTLKELRLPGVTKPNAAEIGQLLGGRFSTGTDDPLAPNAQPPAKGRGPSIVPSRVRPSAPNQQPIIPPPPSVGVAPSSAPVPVGP